MGNAGKKYRGAREQIEARLYGLDEGLALIKKVSFAKFDESVDVAVLLGVDPKHADQMVRGTVVLPHGTGRTRRVLVFASGEKVKEAEDAGADHVGGADVVKKIQVGEAGHIYTMSVTTGKKCILTATEKKCICLVDITSVGFVIACEPFPKIE